MLNLNDISKEIYQVAVEHGWYENEENRNEDVKIALIHSEWSEALEEYRAGRPTVWYGCHNDDLAEHQDCGTEQPGVCDKRFLCDFREKKPEGIMIELIDGCIRILDFMGFREWTVPEAFDTDEKLMDAAKGAELGCFGKPIGALILPEVVRWLHFYVSQYGMDEQMKDPMYSLAEAVGLAFVWIKEQGCDPEELLRTKHEYNKTRPYKHGGKRC